MGPVTVACPPASPLVASLEISHRIDNSPGASHPLFCERAQSRGVNLWLFRILPWKHRPPGRLFWRSCLSLMESCLFDQGNQGMPRDHVLMLLSLSLSLWLSRPRSFRRRKGSRTASWRRPRARARRARNLGTALPSSSTAWIFSRRSPDNLTPAPQAQEATPHPGHL